MDTLPHQKEETIKTEENEPEGEPQDKIEGNNNEVPTLRKKRSKTSSGRPNSLSAEDTETRRRSVDREKRKRKSRSRSRSRKRATIVNEKRTTLNDPNVPTTVKRSRILQEIVDTERTYITALETLTELLQPFLQLQDYEEFPELEARTIHSNGGIILGYSKLLMEMLEPRAENFDENTCISDIFLRLADFMKSKFLQ